ncbi:unnamed protein product [Adineta steineri]|uniref:FAD-binding FR-type domain-containing protein n=1 Tax=Adineta steineri TaxID=433720 RepID=A0A818HUJ2_9BILA|nr:unnamed protein product [Adineta steineri]CAF3513818.1 unnamed protein product [Adineta steineri]
MAGIKTDTRQIKNGNLVNHDHAASNRYSHRQAPSRLRSVIFRQNPLTGFEPRPLTLLERLSLSLGKAIDHRTIPFDIIVRQQFKDLLNEPISKQHQRYFGKYFTDDISTKTFTINEFDRLFQLTSLLTKRILIVFNLNKSYEKNSILGEDIIRIARLLWISPMSIKAFILFKLFDSSDKDVISINDIRSFYEQYLSEVKYFKDEKRLNEVVEIFLQGFFPLNNENQQQQKLNFEQFHQILQQNPSVFKSLYLISIPDQDNEDDEQTIWFKRWWMYIKNNANRILFLILYILISIALIIYVTIYRVITVENHSVPQVIARISGMLVNFNYALAVSLMLKQTMTIIRRLYYLRLFIPVDDHIDAHRFVGTMLFISAMIHSLGHAINFAINLDGHSWFALMFTTAAGIGWVDHSATITGVILFVLLIIMVICSFQCIRQRSGCYQLFRYTHYLFWPIFILLVIHAPDFWKWAIGPMVLFCFEKIYLFKRHLPKYGRTKLISIRIEDEHVLSLMIEKPSNFNFHVGEYINICLPNIVRNEWHPFTICNSPERKDVLRLTIMKKQNWTRKIYEHFSKEQNFDSNSQMTEITVDNLNNKSETNSKNLSLYPREIIFTDKQKDAIVCIEGPFSTCTSYIFDCEHVVLIGAGIGITPYISALESLIYQLREQRCKCLRCGTMNYKQSALTNQKLKKIDFIWVNRDIGNISWFRNILDEFEAEQESYLAATTPSTTNSQSRYLDIHLYCTSIRSHEQAMLGNLPYHLVANMYEVIQHEDMHTQLRTPTHVGRPPWKLLFAKFKAEHRSTNVFFTGNRIMADEIKKHCDEHTFRFQHEPYF